MLTHRMIEVFQGVFERSSISKAAESLYISQPAVSRLIKDLEFDIGFKLFERRQGRIFATDDAQLLYEEVKRSYIGLERIKQIANQIAKHDSGILSITSMPSVGLSVMPNIISNFINRHPHMHITYKTVSSNSVLQSISSAQTDIGIIEASYSSPDAKEGMTFRLNMMCVLPLGHPLEKKKIIAPKDLHKEPFVSLPSNSNMRFQIDALMRTFGVQPELRIETPLTATVCALVVAGCGVSIVDPLTAQRYAAHGLIVKPFMPNIPFSFKVLISKRFNSMQQLVDELHAALEQNIPKEMIYKDDISSAGNA